MDSRKLIWSSYQSCDLRFYQARGFLIRNRDKKNVLRTFKHLFFNEKLLTNIENIHNTHKRRLIVKMWKVFWNPLMGLKFNLSNYITLDSKKVKSFKDRLEICRILHYVSISAHLSRKSQKFFLFDFVRENLKYTKFRALNRK